MNQLKQTALLENTRVIYSGIEQLYTIWCDERKDKENDIRSIPEFLSELIPEKIVPSPNPLYTFYSFMDQEFTSRDDMVWTIGKMLQLYTELEEIKTNSNMMEVPERFESLCDTLQDIANSEVCYMLYSQQDQTELLSVSRYDADLIRHCEGTDRDKLQELRQEDFNKIRSLIQQARIKSRMGQPNNILKATLASTIFVPQTDPKLENINGQNLMIIVLDCAQNFKKFGKGEWVYLVFQYKEEIPVITGEFKEDFLYRIRNMLFLRRDISQECLKYVHILLMAQKSFQYVKKLNEDSIRILHITDIHLDEKNQELMKNFLNKMKSFNVGSGQIDLLAITGDVVNGNPSAGILEKNYQGVADLIREIASKLWLTTDGKLRPDWKKRILLVPGNHDYATMNELQVASVPGNKRVTTAGFPASNEGGPMVKFAYYIEFVCQLLGTDMTQLINNDLNEVRCYRAMGLSMIIANTISAAGPKRNNKVSMNTDKIKQLIDNIPHREMEDQFPLLLCHHSPYYDIEYLLDVYGVYPEGKRIDKKEQLSWFKNCEYVLNQAFALAQMWENIGDCYQKWDELIHKLDQILDKACIFAFGTANQQITLEERLEYDFIANLFQISTQMKQHSFVYTELMADMRLKLKNGEEMSEIDNKILTAQFDMLKTYFSFQTVLSGHIHELKINPASEEETSVSSVPCIEGDRWYKEIVTKYKHEHIPISLNYGILEIGCTSRNNTIKYTAYKFAYKESRGPEEIKSYEWNIPKESVKEASNESY